jgi:hypothetical protein
MRLQEKSLNCGGLSKLACGHCRIHRLTIAAALIDPASLHLQLHTLNYSQYKTQILFTEHTDIDL